MDELAHLAAVAVGSSSCSNVEKLAEGQYNKVFLMTTEAGKEVIVKVPHPNAGRPHFTTASEVATMDYARNVLGLPIPKIHAWNSQASTNSVGAKYIIMEKAPGKELAHVWPTLDGNAKLSIVRSIIQFEKIFTTSNFGAMGGLYYADQVEGEAASIAIDRRDQNSQTSEREFVIGPTTDRRFFDDGRSKIQCDHGPSIGARELTFVKSLKAFPKSPGIFGGPGWYKPSTKEKLACLQDYISVAQYLAPEDPSVSAAVLWHDDLHLGNIFVNPEDPTTITCIIDWQSTHVSPLFRHVRHPEFLDFDGPKVPLGPDVDPRKMPDLPSNFQELSEQEQKDVRRKLDLLVRQRALYKLYEIYSARENPDVYQALLFDELLQGQLIDLAGVAAYHSEPVIKKLLMQLEDDWEQVPQTGGHPCPLHYTELERENNAEELTKWSECTALLTSVMESLGNLPSDWDGAVSHEDFLTVKERLQVVREEFLNHMAKTNEERSQWAEAWPFKDDEAIDE
ncbi:MAG: hypothetical protein Q9179_003029 [Wetmoreana sp. 5 TL-2023]